MAKSLLEGLDFIHSRGIAHGDVKLDNILQTKGSQDLSALKFCDLGHAFRGRSCYERGTKFYNAPEQVLSQYYEKKVDIWALGVCFMEIFIGRHLYDTLTDSRTELIFFI